MITDNQIKTFHHLKDKMSLEQLDSAKNIIMGKIELIKRNKEIVNSLIPTNKN